MKPAPTLIDALYRASFHPEANPGWRSNVEMRHALESARRFIVDERMSAFMAELANEAFLKDTAINLRILNSLRVSARLPHESIWIEYMMRPYQVRSHELRKESPPDLINIGRTEGWLIQQHPKIETASIMHLFTDSDAADTKGYRTWTFPFAFGWMADDSPLPWQTIIKSDGTNEGEPNARADRLGLRYSTPSAFLSGISGYHRDNVSCVRSRLIIDPIQENQEQYRYLLTEWMGVLRRVWSLLAAIDHLPIAYGEVRQSKGFLARGRIRKFLDHKTITLNIPAKRDTRVIARQAIAAAHRKRHEVRAHWRDDWRNPPSKHCNPHLWEFVDENNPDLIRCELCRGRQFHVIKHERGDAGLGYVTHDYVVKHETDDERTV